jgi:hypothetical protein
MTVLLSRLATRKKKIFMKERDLKRCEKESLKMAYSSIRKRYRKNKELYNGKSGITSNEFIAAFIVVFHAGVDKRGFGSSFDTYMDQACTKFDCAAGKNRSIIDMFILLNTHYGYEFDLFLNGILTLAKNLQEEAYPPIINNEFKGLRCGDVCRFVFSFKRHGSPFKIASITGKEWNGWTNYKTSTGISDVTIGDLLLNNKNILDSYFQYRHKMEIQIYDKKV